MGGSTGWIYRLMRENPDYLDELFRRLGDELRRTGA